MRVEYTIVEGRRVQALKQKHSQNWTDSGSYSRHLKRRGIHTNDFDGTQRSQVIGFKGKPR